MNPRQRIAPARSSVSWFSILGVGILLALLLETFEVIVFVLRAVV
jgi:hypothetical protein